MSRSTITAKKRKRIKPKAVQALPRETPAQSLLHETPVTDNPLLIAYRNQNEVPMKLVPAPVARSWINATDRQLRQALLAAKDEQGAAMVANMHSEITVYPQRFLLKYRIYRVLYYSPYKPILLYLGLAPGLPLYSLAGNPEAFLHMAQADGVDLVSLDMAINYVSVFLEVTRNMYELVYQVNSVDQLRFIPRLSPAQLEAKEALAEKYRSTLTAPIGEATDEGYMVIAHVVRQQELERHTLKVRRNGEVESEVTIIEQGMPVVIGI